MLDEVVSGSVVTRTQLESLGPGPVVGHINHTALRSTRGSEKPPQEAKIDGVGHRLDAKIEGVDLKLSTEIRQLRWMMGGLAALSAALLVKLLPELFGRYFLGAASPYC